MEEKDPNSARSKSAQKSDEYAATYSESIKSVILFVSIASSRCRNFKETAARKI